MDDLFPYTNKGLCLGRIFFEWHHSIAHDTLAYHFKCQNATFIQVHQNFFVFGDKAIFPLFLKFVVLALAFSRITNV